MTLAKPRNLQPIADTTGARPAWASPPPRPDGPDDDPNRSARSKGEHPATPDTPTGGSSAVSGAPQRLGVYIHFPWCRTKCPYCDFLSVPTDDVPSRDYADAVICELERRAALLGHSAVGSIFVGGGTPSLWEPQQLGRVLEAAARRLELLPDCEITMEANPSSLDLAKARAFRAAGVNRLSLGVQSLRDDALRFLGRLHTGQQARRAVEAAIHSGIPRVSADLIFGVPFEVSDEVVADAATLVELGVEHLSVYSLTVEPGTVFGARARQGRLPLALDDDVAESFERIRGALLGRGFDHYEISNYARPGARSRHNLGYWEGRPYLGLGCAAWGTLPSAGVTWRYRNTPSPARYLAGASSWSRADLAVFGTNELQAELERLTPETLLLERLMLGLRVSDGLDIDEEARRLGVDAWNERRSRAYDRLLGRGVLELDGKRTRIAPRHWLLTDTVLAELA